jgi:NADH dehydrogenase
MNIPNSTLPRIIIIVEEWLKLKNCGVRQTHYHTFQPLLYQVATGGLEAGSSYPIRKVIQEYDEFYFRLTNVRK